MTHTPHPSPSNVVTTLRLTAVAVALAALAAAPALAQGAAKAKPVSQKEAAATFKQACSPCHGLQGEGKPGVPPLNGNLRHGTTAEDVAGVIHDGVKGTPMMPFKGRFTDAQIEALAKYVLALAKH